MRERERLKIVRGDGNDPGNVEVYLSKKMFLEEGKIILILEIIRGEMESVEIELFPSEIEGNKIYELTDYGVNIDIRGHDGNALRQEIIRAMSEGKEEYYHREVGWYENKKDNKLIFKTKNLMGGNYKSKLKSDRFELETKGSLEEWKKEVNEILKNEYIELIMVLGFSSVLTKFTNMKGIYTGSLILNLSGGISRDRDNIISVLNSIWSADNNKSLTNIFSTSFPKIEKAIKGNNGLPFFIKDMSKDKGIEIINNIQEMDFNSTVIVNGNKNLISDKNGRESILSRDNIIEINLDAYNVEDFKKNFGRTRRVIKNNYGHAGEKFIKNIFDKGIENIELELEELKDSLAMELKESNYKGKYEKIETMAIILLTGKHIKESLDLNIDLERVKKLLLELNENNVEEIAEYKKALEDIKDYFNENRDKFVLEKKDIKKSTIGRYKEIDGNVVEIRILNADYKKIMNKLKYDHIKIKKIWEKNGITKFEKGREDIEIGIGDSRGIIIILGGEI